MATINVFHVDNFIIMNKRILKNIGKIIKGLRKDKGLSQEKLAELCYMSRNAIGSIERGEVNVPVLTLYKIAEALKIEPYELLPY